MDKWEDINLGDLVTISSSKRIYASDYVDKGVPFYRSKEIIEFYHGKDVSLELFISEKKYLGIKEKYGVPSTGDVLVTSVGTIGVPMLIKNDAPFYFKDGNLIWIKLSKSKNQINPKYFYFFLDSDYGKAKLDSILIGSSQKALTITGFNKLKIKLPPLGYQKKIASILSAYDDLIENNLKRIKLLEEKAQLTYEEWFVRMKYPGHANDNVDSETGLPEGWMKGVLSDIIGFQNGFAYKSTRFEKSGFPVIKIKNIEDNTISISNVDFINPSYADETQKFRLYSGDLLIAMTGATVGKVGFVPILKKHAYLNQRVGRFLAKSKNNNTSFVKSFFTVGDGLKHVTNIASGAAQPNISSSQILSIPLNIPTSKLLNKYSALSEKINKNILLLRSQNQNLKMAVSILLPRLMSGMIDLDEIKYNYPKEILE